MGAERGLTLIESKCSSPRTEEDEDEGSQSREGPQVPTFSEGSGSGSGEDEDRFPGLVNVEVPRCGKEMLRYWAVQARRRIKAQRLMLDQAREEESDTESYSED